MSSRRLPRYPCQDYENGRSGGQDGEGGAQSMEELHGTARVGNPLDIPGVCRQTEPEHGPEGQGQEDGQERAETQICNL